MIAQARAVRALAIAAVVCAVSSPARAASPALSIELVESEPVGVRVSAPVAPKTSCEGAPVVFEGVVEKGKPLAVASDAFHLCVAQTEAPFTKASFGPALAVQHLAGLPPVRVVVRSRRTLANVPLRPSLAMSPLTVGVYGDQRIGVRVAVGPTTPCNADGNKVLFEGPVDPGTPRVLATEAACVCVEHTYAPFVNAGWTNARSYCRPARCVAKICVTDPDAPFTVSLPSRAPS